MIRTILITGTIGMIVGFGGTLMSLFGGGTMLMEYLEFDVMLVLFLVMMIGTYWFVVLNPRGREVNNVLVELSNAARSLLRRKERPYREPWIEK